MTTTTVATVGPNGEPVFVLQPDQFTALAACLVLIAALLAGLLVAQIRRP